MPFRYFWATLYTIGNKAEMCPKTLKLSFGDTYQQKTNDYVLLPGNGLNYSPSKKIKIF